MDKYGALVFLFTFTVDILLLRGAAQGDNRTSSRIRAVIAALTGAGYALFALRAPLNLTGKACGLAGALLAMGAIAFGFEKEGIGRWFRFLFLWLVANAMAVGVSDMDGWFLVLAAALLFLLVLLGPDGGAGREVVDVMIQYGGETVQLQALRDNGNLLRDPVSGENVLIVSPWVARKLLGLTQTDLLHPIETLERGEAAGLRLIPYSAVGQPGGMLLAMRFASVRIGGQKKSRIVAFSPNPIGDGRQFQALAGGMV